MPDITFLIFFFLISQLGIWLDYVSPFRWQLLGSLCAVLIFATLLLILLILTYDQTKEDGE